ncbi:MAG: DUF805 domain-containing protein [Massilia sp.]
MNNPYIAPSAQLNEVESGDETYQPEFFTFDGRIGRLRYIAYSMGTSIVLGIAAVLLTLILPKSVGGVVATILTLFAWLMPSIRRLNDMDQNGWLSILALIPLLNFFFGLWMLFGRGTDGRNEYGPAPCPNTGGVIACAIIVPVVAVIGSLAAVAIPAYSAYVLKAKAMNGNGPRTELRVPARQAARTLPIVLQARAGQA